MFKCYWQSEVEALEVEHILVPRYSPSIPHTEARDQSRYSEMRHGRLISSALPRTIWSLAFFEVVYKTSVPTENAICLRQRLYTLFPLVWLGKCGQFHELNEKKKKDLCRLWFRWFDKDAVPKSTRTNMAQRSLCAHLERQISLCSC